MFKMIVGISLMSVVAEMFLSDIKFKKYVRSIIGIFTFVIIIEGVFSLEPLNIDFNMIDEAQRISDITLSQAESEIIKIYENNIKQELKNNQIDVVNINVKCDGNMTVKNIYVKLKNIEYKEKTMTLLVENFGLEKSLIEIS